MEGAEYNPRHWYQCESAREQAETLIAIGEQLREDSASRRDRCLAQLRSFEGCEVEDLSPWGYSHIEGSDLKWPLARSACESVQAKIAGKQKPRPQFLTSGGNYRQRRRAERLNKFVEGCWAQPQGRYHNLWELTARVQLDCEIFHGGAVKVQADSIDERVYFERVLPWRILVDDVEAMDGNPRTMIHYYPYDKEKLKARYATKEHLKRLKKNGYEALTLEELESLIEGAESVEPGEVDVGRQPHRLADMIWVWEAWRLPVDDEHPGTHMIAAAGIPLDWEEWTDPEFPIAVLRWTEEAWGYWGTSLVDIVRPIEDEVRATLDRLQESVTNNAQMIVQVERGAELPEDLQSNESCIIVERNPGTAPANIQVPPPFHDKVVQWLEMNRSAIFEVSGVSQMSAQSRKEPGITSGVAIRNMNDIETERFALQATAYENFHVAMARKTVQAMRRVAKAGKDPGVAWPGLRFMREFRWSEVSLEDDQYHLQVFPSSSLPSTPAGRLATVQEMMTAGMISPENARRLLGWADIEQFSRREDAQREYVDELIERFLDAEDDAHLEELGGFESPEPFMGVEQATVQAAQAYFEAKLDRAPEFNLGLLRDWIAACDDLLKAAEQAQMQAQQQAQMMAQGAAPGVGAPPPIPGAPGAPPGPAGPPPAGPPMAPNMAA